MAVIGTKTKETLRELTPSQKFVYKMLEYHGPMTQKELTEMSLLPKRTVRYSLRILQDEDLVVERRMMDDPRVKQYKLKRR